MTSLDSMTYTFVSQAYADDEEAFFVKSFTGREGISQLYEYDIHLLSDDPEIDLKAVLTNPATFTLQREEGDIPVHGIIAHFEQLPEIRSSAQYRAVLVPRLWQADLYHQNQLFLNKRVPDIIEAILQQTGLTSQDYELRLTGSYPEWEYICQYNETDFNFISRWMEREGIYYFFEQSEQGEKLIITDSASAHNPRPESAVSYVPPTGEVPQEDVIRDFICIHKRIPQKVVLQDYNYRSPSQMLRAEADVDPQGQGTVYIYGEHFKTSEQGNGLARIRAEALLCRERIFHGEAIVPDLSPGFLFDLEDHFRPSYNQQYLITEITHQGSQTGFHSDTGGQAGQKYSNVFSSIPSEIQFRPKRRAMKPKFYGTMNAKVDAAGDGEYAELDDQGRYKLTLPFDQSGRSDGKASRFVRMAQPYAGPNYGVHFPLHKEAEVLLTFVDGDPDRPVIAASIPNPETGSPVNSENQSQSAIWTAGENRITLEDREGEKNIHIYQACGNEVIMHEQTPDITIKQACGNQIIMKAEVPKIEIKQQCGNQAVMNGAQGGEHIRFFTPFNNTLFEMGMCPSGKVGFAKKTDGDWHQLNTGTKSTTTAGIIEEHALSAKFTETLGMSSDIFMGGKFSSMLGAEVKKNYSREITKNWADRDRDSEGHLYYSSDEYIELEAGKQEEASLLLNKGSASAVLKSGKSKVTIKKDDDINIYSKKKSEYKAQDTVVLNSVSGRISLTAKEVKATKGKFKTKNIIDIG